MPKKRFDEGEYDPIAAEVARDAARRPQTQMGEESAAAAAPAPAPATAQPKRAAPSLPAPPNVRPLRPETPRDQASNERETKPARAAATKGSLIVKRFQVSQDEDFELTVFVQRLQQRSRTKVSLSTIARALFNVAMHAEESIAEELAKGQSMRRPANDDAMELAAFEDQWSQVLSAALRKARPVK